ncbi:MAG TPA: 4-coumarate--CoA ligase, partial [Burkholderiaceae bacterium]|nr:4-coumarate--CoA ligase [Burkholderiaceae bacterium]
MTAPITVAAAEPLPDFQTLPDLIAAHARARPESIALVCGEQRMSYAQLDAEMDRVAATLQRDGLKP